MKNEKNKFFIADLHIHSHYSLATSKNLTPEHLDYWAALKGIDIVGTGDCLHPGWLKELKEKLSRCKNGFYTLKKEYIIDERLKHPLKNNIYFVPTTEISCIFKKHGTVKKTHVVIIFPDFETVEEYQKRLIKIGNLSSDGRPILGIDPKNLLDILLQISGNSLFIPAHIWTPWFSVLGSKSGFDRIEDCFEDLTGNIFAVETGLSSDPPMNWLCSFLDRFTLISNSDAHSPEKLGREANIFKGEISYENLYNSIVNNNSSNFHGTIEFFPQEGKYHLDGHRKCDICFDPLQTLKNEGICPNCGKHLTKGVLYRVAELSDRFDIDNFQNKKEFYSITPLAKTISEFLETSPASKKVKAEYFKLIGELGSEFDILLNRDLTDIAKKYNGLFAEGIRRIREKEVIINSGYDGEFGEIKVFSKEELSAKSIKSYGLNFSEEMKIFSNAEIENFSNENFKQRKNPLLEFDITEFLKLKKTKDSDKISNTEIIKDKIVNTKNTAQYEAITHFSGPCLTVAGPGSGKTFALTERIKYLVLEKKIQPYEIMAITFTNKACDEIKRRLEDCEIDLKNILTLTFHSAGMMIISENLISIGRHAGFLIINENQKNEILSTLFKLSKTEINKLSKEISSYKQRIISDIDEELQNLTEIYDEELQKRNLFDIDDLVFIAVKILENNPEIQKKYLNKIRWILIDEYQDINKIQFDFVKLLISNEQKNLFVIGDPNQAIYGFRGSDQSYILNFKKDFPDAKIIELDKSYRCPEIILSAASQIIDREKNIFGLESGLKIKIKKCDTSYSEADWIASEIERMIGGVRHFSIDSGKSDGNEIEGVSGFGNFAVLCRTAEQFSQLKKAFMNHAIPFSVYGEKPFYETEPFATVLNEFRKKITEDVDGKLSANKNKSLNNSISVSATLTDFFENSGILNSPENNENFLHLKNIAENTDSDFNTFFNTLNLRASIDFLEKKSETVSLITLHSSKGLEFETVFIAGCEDKIIPFEVFGTKSKNEIDEESRLFYVAMTRAKKFLYLSYALKRYWKKMTLNQRKSRFLDKIEKSLYNNLKTSERKIKKKDDSIPLPF